MPTAIAVEAHSRYLHRRKKKDGVSSTASLQIAANSGPMRGRMPAPLFHCSVEGGGQKAQCGACRNARH